ncbi:MAG: 4-(cytidine 5'-diphospho)-2-C-methyl-D-erythritol kinase [Pseudomonadales bacterium]|nr:4-(cytidine 5'-diphospho)-2-C-methyl-D-erythritol kinase [Pseudomonadales bacterium]MCP5215507.1 4-(cytidine 5'-diphospho)-2-C-methyl-D-erythritol kinase [Pseudomonadales bacterium]
MSTSTLSLPAPAKLNLMLHITGRRTDGYHLLQTIFQFINYCDQLSFTLTKSPEIRLNTELDNVSVEQNLIYRAAKLLQAHTATKQGANVSLIKNIPIGGGLGGGSSDAATTLIGLNQLWRTGLSLQQLAEMGLTLGADVPVFIHGCASWAEGVGEQLTKVQLAEPWYLVITPACQVSTTEIFSHKELTRNTPAITIATALGHGGKNDCESVVSALYPEVKMALNWLNQFAKARLTGTGSSLFASFETRQQAEQVFEQLPTPLTGFIAQGSNLSPLHQKAKIRTVL